MINTWVHMTSTSKSYTNWHASSNCWDHIPCGSGTISVALSRLRVSSLLWGPFEYMFFTNYLKLIEVNCDIDDNTYDFNQYLFMKLSVLVPINWFIWAYNFSCVISFEGEIAVMRAIIIHVFFFLLSIWYWLKIIMI